MGNKAISNDLSKIHEESRKEFNRVYSAIYEDRNLCREDRRFYSIAGAQWEGKLSDQFENKPQPEINKTLKAVIEIVDEYRNNPVTVKFVPKDGTKNDQLSDALNGMFRADEADSCAKEAYDNAFEEGASGGFGGWRLTNQYEDEYDEDNDYQRIRIEPIFEADSSIFFDLDAKKQDKSDARKCWVISSMTHELYKEKYDDEPTSWSLELSKNEFDWCTPEAVYVAEYYVVEETSERVQVWRDLTGKETKYTDQDFERNENLLEELESTGAEKIRDKKVKKRRVHKYIMSGNAILEDLGYIAGTEIPIIPMYGKRWFINNIERCMGHVRPLKDPQRIKNMQTAKLMEISALSSVEKPYFTPQQVLSHMTMHSNDNVINYPFLFVDPITDSNGNEVAQGPLGYTKVPQIPPALTGLIQLCDNDMTEIGGVSQANEEMVSNISGKAIRAIQNKIDMKTFIYISNFAKAIERTGDVWLSMAKDIYVEEGRKLKTIGDQKQTGTVKLYKPVINEETGAIEYENDISKAKMGVSVTVGPTSDSKRQATVENTQAMMGFVQDPETLNVLSHLAISNMDGEGIQDIRDWSRNKLLQIGAVKPTEEEAKILQAQAQKAQEPDANEMLLLSAAQEAQSKAKKAEADAIKAFAEIEETQADTEKKRAETLEILSDMNRKDLSSMVSVQNPPSSNNQNPGRPE